MKLRTQDIHNIDQRVAAELVVELTKRPRAAAGDTITLKDLDDAKKLVDQALETGVNNLNISLDEAIRFKHAIGGLRDRFDRVANRLTVAFCEVVAAPAIVQPQVRATAQVLSELYGRPGGEVFLADILHLKEVMLPYPRMSPGILSERDKKIYAAIDAGALPEASIDHLSRFMTYGRGDLVSHGKVQINGREFNEVFRLPLDGKTDIPTAIAEYEKRFAKCGYDRIYMRGSEGGLYLTLNASGALDDIDSGFKAHIAVNHEHTFSGEVAFVADVTNSLTEATVGFWKKSINRMASALRSALSGRADNKIAEIAAAISKDNSSGAPPTATTPAKKIDVKNTILTGSVAASIGVASINVPIALSVLAGTMGAVSIANAIDFLVMQRTKAPIYQAIGLS